MSLLDKIKRRNAERDSVFHNTATVNGHSYDRYVLEEKAKLNKPMTDEEHTALTKFRTKDISNQIARVAGVITIVALLILAIGCFLYPYSLFNLIGSGDRFWDCWGNLKYHVSGGDLLKAWSKVGYDFTNPDVLEQLGVTSGNAYAAIWADMNGATYNAAEGTFTSGWLSINQIMRIAFEDGTSAKVGFLTIGAWSIIVLSTIGLIAAITASIYMLSYNIADLVKLVRHGAERTKGTVRDVRDIVVNTINGTDDDKTMTIGAKIGEDVPKPKTTRKRTTKKAEPAPEVQKTEEELEEEEIDAKIKAYKEEIERENSILENKPEPEIPAETVTPVQPATVTVEPKPVLQERRNAKTAEPDYDNMSEDELNAMLSK